MSPKNQLDLCDNHLDRILAQFSKIDSRASIVLASDLGMLTILILNLPVKISLCSPLLLVVIPLILICLSLGFLYKSQFPNLKGGANSLIYFSEIAKNTEAGFMGKFLSMSEEDASKELLSQIWRNSVILSEKFKYLKTAMLLMGCAIPFWLIAVGLFAHANNIIKLI